MIQTQERGTEAWWTETGAEEWADAIVAAMKLGGVDNLFFVSGSELSFYQEAIAKAQTKGRPAPRLVTRLSRADDGRHRAAGVSRFDARRPRRRRAMGPGASRPGRDRTAVHQA